MFLNNKYYKWYINIIKKAQSENRSKKEKIIYEKHHIKPRSLGGKNYNSNLVYLTFKEHFICHLLLIKAVIPEHKMKMQYAFYKMSKSKKHPNRYNSNLYSYFKIKFRKNISGKNNPNYGKKWSTEKRIKMSKFVKDNRPQTGKDNPMYGKPRFDLIQRNKLKKAWITDGATDKLVLQDNLDVYLNNGWQKGRTKGTNTNSTIYP